MVVGITFAILAIKFTIISIVLSVRFGYSSSDIAARVYMLIIILLSVFPPMLIFKFLVLNKQVRSKNCDDVVFKPYYLAHYGSHRDMVIESSALKGKEDKFIGFQLIDKKSEWNEDKKVNFFKNVFKEVNARAATEG